MGVLQLRLLERFRDVFLYGVSNLKHQLSRQLYTLSLDTKRLILQENLFLTNILKIHLLQVFHFDSQWEILPFSRL